MRFIFFLSIALMAGVVQAAPGEDLVKKIPGELDLTGFIALDTRLFTESPAYPGQRWNSGPSLVAQPEIYWVSPEETHTLTFRPFYHAEPYDSRRDHGDIRELSWLYVRDPFDIKIGLAKEFWGVIETKHLVNIINQTDAVEDIDGEDKFGQPMVRLSWFSGFGAFRFFYMPYFRERSFPGTHGRLRPPLMIDTDNPHYESDAEEWQPSIALRYEHTLGNWDIGLGYFAGTSREPRVAPNATMTALEPYYDEIQQPSLDLQYTKDAWLLKLEALYRTGHDRGFGAVSAGAEYTFFDIKSTGADIGALIEYHWDDRSLFAPPTTLEDDVFLGTRIALNDTGSAELLGGMSIDSNDGSQAYTVELSRRFGSHWKIEADARIFGPTESGNFAVLFRQDDFIQFRVSRYF